MSALDTTEFTAAAERLQGGEVSLKDVVNLFSRAFFYARTSSDAPRLFVADLGERGRWTCVFSSPEKLAHAVGECDYLGMPGTDFLDFTPAGVGIVVDPTDEHALALKATTVGYAARMRSRSERDD